MPNLIRFYLPLVICFWAITLSSARAQESPATSTLAAPPQDEAMAVQKKFSELVQKANQQPELQKLKAQLDEAQKAYKTALDAAITKEDPDILAKFKALQQSAIAAPQGQAMPFIQAGFDQFSPADRQMLLDTRKQAMDTPAVKAAREKRNTAKTEDERRAADKEYKAALEKAMRESNAQVGPLLDKLAVKPTPVPLITPVPASASSNSPVKTP